MKIPLKAIYSAAPNRAAGYTEEVKKRGKIQGSDVELSESDFKYISENFKLGAKIKVQAQSKVEISKAVQEVKSEFKSEFKTELKIESDAPVSGKVPQVAQILFR